MFSNGFGAANSHDGTPGGSDSIYVDHHNVDHHKYHDHHERTGNHKYHHYHHAAPATLVATHG
jgi:hypothetical protein